MKTPAKILVTMGVSYIFYKYWRSVDDRRISAEETPVTFAGDPNETPAAMFERLADKTPPSIEIQVERFGRSKAFAFHKNGNVKD